VATLPHPGPHQHPSSSRRPQDDWADEWLPARDLDQALIEDWEAGLEVAPAARILDMRQYGMQREFLLAWEDGADVSQRAAGGQLPPPCAPALALAAMACSGACACAGDTLRPVGVAHG
jgi:hypothetical protein